MRDVYQPQKKRRRMGTVMFAGVGVFIGAYFPANLILMLSFQSEEKGEFGKLAMPVSMGVSVLLFIIISTRASTIRRGIIGGIILGLLAGTGCLAGIGGAMMMRMNAGIAAELEQAQGEEASETVQTTEEADPVNPLETAPAPPSESTDAPEPKPIDPALAKKVEEYQQRFTAEMGRFVIICLPPNILLGAFIGGVFAKAAIRRRELSGR